MSYFEIEDLRGAQEKIAEGAQLLATALNGAENQRALAQLSVMVGVAAMNVRTAHWRAKEAAAAIEAAIKALHQPQEDDGA